MEIKVDKGKNKWADFKKVHNRTSKTLKVVRIIELEKELRHYTNVSQWTKGVGNMKERLRYISERW